jgi:hypothetical protein
MSHDSTHLSRLVYTTYKCFIWMWGPLRGNITTLYRTKYSRSFRNSSLFSQVYYFLPFFLKFIRAPPYGGCLIVISLSVCARVRNEVFRIVLYTVSYRNLKLSKRFCRGKLQNFEFTFRRGDHVSSGVTCPWIFFFTIGHMHATVFQGGVFFLFFFYTFSYYIYMPKFYGVFNKSFIHYKQPFI